MRKSREEKKQDKILFGVIILFLGIIGVGIGYANLNQNLKVTSSGNVRSAKWDIHFTSASVSPTEVTDSNSVSYTNSVSYSATSITFNGTLTSSISSCSATTDVSNGNGNGRGCAIVTGVITNAGTINAKMTNVSVSSTIKDLSTNSTTTNNGITYNAYIQSTSGSSTYTEITSTNITNYPSVFKLNTGQSRNIKIVVYYKSSTALPSNDILLSGLTYTFTYLQDS